MLVNNNYIQFGNVVYDFHGQPLKLLGASVVRFVCQLLLKRAMVLKREGS